MTSKRLHSDDYQAGQDKSVEIPATGPIIRTDQEIEVVDGPLANSYQAELAFNEEMLDVMVAESTDPNAENPIQVANQGINQFFWRGQVQPVKRKFVEILARAKTTDVKTHVEQRGVGDEPINRINKHTALRYPFSIIRDENPRGRDWLKKVLAEA